MLMYNLIEYSNNYSKTSGSFWKYYRDGSDDTLTQSESLKSKVKITGETHIDGNMKGVERVIKISTGAGKFAITDTKSYVPVVTLLLRIIKNCFNN